MLRFQIFLFPLATIAFGAPHKIVQKSLQRASTECVLYGSTDHCLARCTTLITRDWDDKDGLLSVYDRFYKPDPSDLCNSKRTQTCMYYQKPGNVVNNTCLRASDAVQCYLDQNGQVILNEPRFVRTTTLQKQQVIWECGAMLGHSRERIWELVADTEFRLQETKCLFRCFQIRTGMYNDVRGLHMERFYVACGGYEDDFYLSVPQCMADVRKDGSCDKCSLAQRMVTGCIGSRYDSAIFNANQTITATQGSQVFVINQMNNNVGTINNNLNFG